MDPVGTTGAVAKTVMMIPWFNASSGFISPPLLLYPPDIANGCHVCMYMHACTLLVSMMLASHTAAALTGGVKMSKYCRYTKGR